MKEIGEQDPCDCARVENPEVFKNPNTCGCSMSSKGAVAAGLQPACLEFTMLLAQQLAAQLIWSQANEHPQNQASKEEYALQTINWLESKQIRSCGEGENKLARRDGRRPHDSRKTELQTLRSRRIRFMGYRTDTCFEVPLFSCEIFCDCDLEGSMRKGWLLRLKTIT